MTLAKFLFWYYQISLSLVTQLITPHYWTGLKTGLGYEGTVPNWFMCNLQERKYSVTIGYLIFKQVSMTCGLPQGSILGPLLFDPHMLLLSQQLQLFQNAAARLLSNIVHPALCTGYQYSQFQNSARDQYSLTGRRPSWVSDMISP